MTFGDLYDLAIGTFQIRSYNQLVILRLCKGIIFRIYISWLGKSEFSPFLNYPSKFENLVAFATGKNN